MQTLDLNPTRCALRPLLRGFAKKVLCSKRCHMQTYTSPNTPNKRLAKHTTGRGASPLGPTVHLTKHTK